MLCCCIVGGEISFVIVAGSPEVLTSEKWPNRPAIPSVTNIKAKRGPSFLTIRPWTRWLKTQLVTDATQIFGHFGIEGKQCVIRQ